MKETKNNNEQIIADQEQTIADQEQTIADQEQTIADQEQTIADQEQSFLAISEVLENITSLLSSAIELRDPYTKGHSEHVAELTENIARILFNDKFNNLKLVRSAALLHDVGKITISENVLNKPTLLSEAEFEMIKCHTTLGEKLIRPVKYDKLLSDAVLFHHEDYDGNGYPYRLKGENIPLIARIIRVADYFDALTTSRPYREQISVPESIEIMEKNRRCFDLQIFDFFKENLCQLTRRCM
jgi:putative nucleotidyltransferase with HDIG domain